MSERYEYLVAGDAGEPGTAAARSRLAQRQAELLSALVAGGPLPPGFDPVQVRIQAGGLTAKRLETVAKVAPELPVLLGDRFGPEFRRYAAGAPMTGGYRADALAFASWLLDGDTEMTHRQRLGLVRWHRDRAGATPPGRLRLVLGTPLGWIGRLGGRPGGGQ